MSRFHFFRASDMSWLALGSAALAGYGGGSGSGVPLALIDTANGIVLIAYDGVRPVFSLLAP